MALKQAIFRLQSMIETSRFFKVDSSDLEDLLLTITSGRAPTPQVITVAKKLAESTEIAVQANGLFACSVLVKPERDDVIGDLSSDSMLAAAANALAGSEPEVVTAGLAFVTQMALLGCVAHLRRLVPLALPISVYLKSKRHRDESLKFFKALVESQDVLIQHQMRDLGVYDSLVADQNTASDGRASEILKLFLPMTNSPTTNVPKTNKEELRKLMWHNRRLFSGKVILDIGCGNGVLSVFAALAGASHVYGIDMSDNIEQAKAIVERNGLADKVTIIRGKMEEIKLPVQKVDIIISEWMGHCLFYESKLETVLYARDKFLAPGGLVFPNRATLQVCAIKDQQYKDDKFTGWTNVYGFDRSTASVSVVDRNQVVTNSCVLREIDLQTFTVDDIPFESLFKLQIEKTEYIQGFVTFFNIEFNKDGFSTAPEAPYTHWKQTVFYLENDITCQTGEKLSGVFRMRPNLGNKRDLDFEIDVDFRGELCSLTEKNKYCMW